MAAVIYLTLLVLLILALIAQFRGTLPSVGKALAS